MKTHRRALLTLIFILLSNNLFSSPLVIDSKGFSNVAKKVLPCTVKVSVFEDETQRSEAMKRIFRDEKLREFFNMPTFVCEEDFRKKGDGSGFIVSPEGHIVTNRHVISGAKDVVVTLSNGQEYRADVIHEAKFLDIAFLKIGGGDTIFPHVELEDSEVSIGDFAIAFGSPLGLRNSMTYGVVSATGRELGFFAKLGLPSLIQTDAAVSKGSSGGPLVDVSGKVIGMNSALINKEGIGFAIPSFFIKPMLNAIVSEGKFNQGMLGIIPHNGSNESEVGAFLGKIAPNSPAELAGLKSGDVVIEMEGKPINSFANFYNYLSVFPESSEIHLKIKRDNGIIEKIATLTGEEKSDLHFKLEGLSLMDVDIQECSSFSLPNGKKRGIMIYQCDNNPTICMPPLEEGSIVLEFNNLEVESVEELREKYEDIAINSGFLLTVWDSQRSEKFYLGVEKK